MLKIFIVIFQIFVENEYDFVMLNKAAQDGRYAVTVFEPFYFRRPQTSHVVSLHFNHNSAVHQIVDKPKLQLPSDC